jgi:uncharacterized protein YbcI
MATQSGAGSTRSVQMASEDGQSQGTPARVLTRRMVQLHKEFYGRGPTRAKAHLQDDSIMVLMRGGFTAAEETLLRAGRGDSVARQRRDFQAAMRERFTEMVEEVTGRKVVAFMNSTHQDPDLILRRLRLGELLTAARVRWTMPSDTRPCRAIPGRAERYPAVPSDTRPCRAISGGAGNSDRPCLLHCLGPV